jgi:DNA-directed RNA polymerase specialized sigma24 family protein
MPNQPHSPSAGPARRSQILKPLLSQNRAILLRQAMKNSGRPADAEDALQDACVRFLTNYEGPAGTEALRWMMLVTKRCAWAIAARHRERESSHELSSGDPHGSTALGVAADAHLDPALLVERLALNEQRITALAGLKHDERTALVLFGLGFSYGEIARKKRWSYTKVNRCITEGRAVLRSRQVH